MPSLCSSSWMRTQPQLRFSRPSCMMSSISCALNGGRPGPRWRRHARYFRRPAPRCHRGSVAGVKRKGSAPVPREEPAEGGQERAVSRPVLDSAMDLALKDAHLVAEHDQFEILVHVGTVARNHKTKEPPEP